MNNPLYDKIVAARVAALKTHDREASSIVSLILADIKQFQVDHRDQGFTDETIVNILNKMIKQRKDSISQYNAGNRPDLSIIEQKEIDYIKRFMPAEVGQTEIEDFVNSVIETITDRSPKVMGIIMHKVKETYNGRVDMKQVSQMVKDKLS